MIAAACYEDEVFRGCGTGIFCSNAMPMGPQIDPVSRGRCSTPDEDRLEEFSAPSLIFLTKCELVHTSTGG
jgi:hypothetical protein